MLKKLFTIGAVIVSGFMLAQTEEQKVITTTTTTTTTTTVTEEPISSVRKNDVMLDPVMSPIGLLNMSYERHLNEYLGIGVSAMFKFSDYVTKDWLWDASILPYIRYYMGKKWARGFFIEGFTGIMIDNFTQTIHYTYENPPKVEMGERFNLRGFAIGAGLGGKWITKKNIVFEVSGGVGYQSMYDILPFMFKGMLGIGYRF